MDEQPEEVEEARALSPSFCVVCGGFSNQLHLFLHQLPTCWLTTVPGDPGSWVLVTSPLPLCPSGQQGEMGPASC